MDKAQKVTEAAKRRDMAREAREAAKGAFEDAQVTFREANAALAVAQTDLEVATAELLGRSTDKIIRPCLACGRKGKHLSFCPAYSGPTDD